jgi:hypothetical protein
MHSMSADRLFRMLAHPAAVTTAAAAILFSVVWAALLK